MRFNISTKINASRPINKLFAFSFIFFFLALLVAESYIILSADHCHSSLVGTKMSIWGLPPPQGKQFEYKYENQLSFFEEICRRTGWDDP
jgi:hypothetical protein